MRIVRKLKKQFNTLLLIAGGRSSDESFSDFKRYIGVGAFRVLGVNPTLQELSKVYGRDLEKEPEYITKVTLGDEEIESLRVSFLVTTSDDAVNGAIDYTSTFNLFLRNRPLVSSREGAEKKVKVIDGYGLTAWVTEEQLKNQEIPKYASGKPASIIPPYRVAVDGEEELVGFIRAYLGIPNPMIYKEGNWLPIPNLEDARVSFDSIPKMFKGDVQEIKDAINIRPENRVKLVLGVKTTDDNKMYQEFFRERPMKFGQNNYSYTEKEIEKRKEEGAYANTEFSIKPLMVHELKPTEIEPQREEAPAKNKWFK